jgi:hypothetical protein
MAMTQITNSPANNLLANYPSGTGTLLNVPFVQCDPTNGNYFVTTGRDLVTFICLPAASAPAYNPLLAYTTGQVVTGGSPATQYVAVASVPVGTPPPNLTYWALYASSTLTLTSAPDQCTGRTFPITGYAVPVFDTAQTSVEFLVLPSSYFTQANGQFQFQASSNLVYVCVRSL